MIYLHIRFHMPSYYCLSCIITHWNGKHRFYMTTTLFYFLENIMSDKFLKYQNPTLIGASVTPNFLTSHGCYAKMIKS